MSREEALARVNEIRPLVFDALSDKRKPYGVLRNEVVAKLSERQCHVVDLALYQLINHGEILLMADRHLELP